MTDETQGAGPSQRSVEIGVALFTAAFALAIIAGSMKAGIDWGAEGPRAGFFPFYVGLTILGASIVNLAHAWSAEAPGKLFADWHQLGQVMSIVLPTALYVALVPYLGIYLASVLLIGAFMMWLGDYAWPQVVAIAVGVPVVTFAIFEKWFVVPLPKGPIEALLGL
jgi:hypothetical protein